MPQVKGAMMVAPADIRIATTAGYAFDFKAGVEKYVPPLAVSEVKKYGVKETKRFTKTATDIPAPVSPGKITSHVQMPDEDETDIMEVAEIASTSDQEAEEHHKDVVFTQAETKVRTAITSMLQKIDPTDWTGAKPKVNVLTRTVRDMSVTASMRDRVLNKMIDAGDISETYAEDYGLDA